MELRCPACGYNLRGMGLEADPPVPEVHCPECGRNVDLDDALLQERLRHLAKGRWWTGTGSISTREALAVLVMLGAMALVLAAVVLVVRVFV